MHYLIGRKSVIIIVLFVLLWEYKQNNKVKIKTSIRYFFVSKLMLKFIDWQLNNQLITRIYINQKNISFIANMVYQKIF